MTTSAVRRPSPGDAAPVDRTRAQRPAASAGAPPLDAAELALAVVQHAPYPIYVKDRLGRYLFVNRSYEQLCTRGEGPLLGRTAEETFAADIAQIYADHDRAALAAGGPVLRESQYSDGEVLRHYYTAKFPVHDRDGRLIGVGGIDTDTTPQALREEALRRSEAQFREMADSVPALIWTCDPAGQCTFVNRRWIEYTGRPLEEQLGRGFEESLHPDDRSPSAEEEARMLTERAPYSIEYRLRRADGEYRWFLDTIASRFDENGAFIGFIGSLVDVTERRRLQEGLARTQRLEAVGRLTGGVAHDFNNLLTVILGNMEMMLEMIPADSPMQMLAQTALAAASRGAALTGRLLAFARHQTLEPRVTDVCRLIEQTRRLLLRTLGEQNRIRLQLPAAPSSAVVDAAELEHALLNLAINARDAMPDGGTLTIGARDVRLDNAAIAAAGLDCQPGEHVAISVSDTGTGMAPEVLRRAVEPFFTTKEVGKGSGLGLSMVYGFCKQSGGDLHIESEPGRGTTVTLYLPRAEGPGASIEADAAPMLANLPGGGEKVLVVEDNAEVRAYVIGSLAALGYEVISAEDAGTAMQQLERHPDVALLFSDVVMPGHNGWELAAAARELNPQLKVLLTSGYAGSRPPGTAAIPLLPKPYLRQTLARRVREVLDAQGDGL